VLSKLLWQVKSSQSLMPHNLNFCFFQGFPQNLVVLISAVPMDTQKFDVPSVTGMNKNMPAPAS
jgi:hypothetical protein